MESSIKGHQDAIEWLQREYAERRNRNPSYSLRAFARQLAMAPGPLSELLARKRKLTKKCAARLAERLGLGSDWGTASAAEAYRPLRGDVFDVIADWEHFAILSLLDTEDFRADPQWIARRLGIARAQASAALEKLFRLGLVQRRKGKLVPISGWATSTDIPSEALRRSHRQNLQQAMHSLDAVPLEERDVTSITMAVDPAKLPQAKQLIREFRHRMAALLESGPRKEVYNLHIQLIPLTRKERE